MKNEKYASAETMKMLEARGYEIEKTETFIEGTVTPFSVITHRPALTEIVDWLWEKYGRFIEIHL
jgi:cytosine/adenosine deaminase-related metal-dependent hydrolase